MRPAHARLTRAWTRALRQNGATGGAGGLACLLASTRADRPFRIDQRRRSVSQHAESLERCLAAMPADTAPFTLPVPADRARFWDTTWAAVYAACGLPANVNGLAAPHLRALCDLLDRRFWDGSIARVARARAWRVAYEVQARVRNLGMNAADYPVANVAVHGPSRTVTLAVQGHRVHWPRYPHRCDGIHVADWRQHMCHAVAHELVHVVRALLRPPGQRGMYDATFHALNRWVYGHRSHLDEDIPADEGGPIVEDVLSQ